MGDGASNAEALAAELPSAATTGPRRAFIAVLGGVNLLFLALDAAARYPSPAAVIAGRVAISLLIFWLATRLGRPVVGFALRRLLGVVWLLLTACFALLAWGAGGPSGPYLAFMPLLPLVVTVAIPDEPVVPLVTGLTAGVTGFAMEAAHGAPPARLALWCLAVGSLTLYGWAGTFLFRRMRLGELEASRARDRAAREAEAALERSRHSEALYRAMAASFPGGFMALFGPDLRFLLADGATAIVAPSEIVGKRAPDFLPPEDAQRVEEAQRAALGGAATRLEIGAAGREVTISAHPVRDARGQVIMGLIVAQDVTEHRALESRLAVTSRLAAMGTLVAGVAHEINNPLSAAMASDAASVGDLRELRRRIAGDGPLDRETTVAELDQVLESVEGALAADRRIAGIVADLALLGRPDAPRSRVRLEDVAEQALRWLHVSVVRSTTVRVEGRTEAEVTASPGQLAQVVINLVTNGAKAVPRGRKGIVTIRLGPGSPGMVRLEVEDNGAGMLPEVMERIFDPFFTTREAGEGMGLGLPICHSIVTAHGGTLTVASRPPEGSTFRVELPVAGPVR